MRPPSAGTARFFGWRVVYGAFTVAFFAWGLGFYGPPIYLQALHESRGWPFPLLSTAVTTHYLIGAVFITRLPWMYRRFSLPRVTAAGIVSMIVGCFGWATAVSPPMLFAATLLTGFGWAVMGGAAVNAIVAPWFTRLRPKALAFAYNGASVGGLVFSPLWVFLITDLVSRRRCSRSVRLPWPLSAISRSSSSPAHRRNSGSASTMVSTQASACRFARNDYLENALAGQKILHPGRSYVVGPVRANRPTGACVLRLGTHSGFGTRRLPPGGDRSHGGPWTVRCWLAAPGQCRPPPRVDRELWHADGWRHPSDFLGGSVAWSGYRRNAPLRFGGRKCQFAPTAHRPGRVRAGGRSPCCGPDYGDLSGGLRICPRLVRAYPRPCTSGGARPFGDGSDWRDGCRDTGPGRMRVLLGTSTAPVIRPA